MTNQPMNPTPMSDAEYHGMHDHLSATGIKRLLSAFDGCPARFKWFQENPEPEKDAWTFGKLAHALILGAGAEIFVSPHEKWNTTAIKAENYEATAQGLLVVKQKDYDIAEQMAAQLQRHELAVKALTGLREHAVVWTCPETGVKCRAKPDSMNAEHGFFADLKTITCAATDKCVKAINDYGYWLSPAHYAEGLTQAEIMSDPAFFFVFQEKQAPYLVKVIEPDAEMIATGQRVAREGRELMAECLKTDTWPGYGDGVDKASLRPWVLGKVGE